jgi:hypothetical protein
MFERKISTLGPDGRLHQRRVIRLAWTQVAPTDAALLRRWTNLVMHTQSLSVAGAGGATRDAAGYFIGSIASSPCFNSGIDAESQTDTADAGFRPYWPAGSEPSLQHER